MEIFSSVELVNGVYVAQIGVGDLPPRHFDAGHELYHRESFGPLRRPEDDASGLSPVEREAFRQFGEPIVECGGTATSGENTFTLPSDPRRMPSQFPVKKQWAISDFANAAAIAALYISTMVTRMTTAKTTQIGLSATGVGRAITTV